MKRSPWLYLLIVVLFLTGCFALADQLYLNPRDLRLSPYVYDETMGWLPKRDFTRDFMQRDAAGNVYHALLSLDHERFRAYGDPRAHRPKILFLGDSYTGDPFTGDKEMYFSVVKSVLHERYRTDAEIFAIGGGGYGTLQEYLLVKDQVGPIDPDIFVLQFSDNDFMDNLYDWERHGIVRNQINYRPYYDQKTGAIFHESSLLAQLHKFGYNNSYIFRRLDILLQGLQFKYYGDYAAKIPPAELEKFHAESYRVTRKELELLRSRFTTKTKLFIMLDPTDDKELNELQARLARETGFTPLSYPVEHLYQYEAAHKGEVLRHFDGGHLNIAGNRVLGEGLADDLANHLGWREKAL